MNPRRPRFVLELLESRQMLAGDFAVEAPTALAAPDLGQAFIAAEVSVLGGDAAVATAEKVVEPTVATEAADEFFAELGGNDVEAPVVETDPEETPQELQIAAADPISARQLPLAVANTNDDLRLDGLAEIDGVDSFGDVPRFVSNTVFISDSNEVVVEDLDDDNPLETDELNPQAENAAA